MSKIINGILLTFFVFFASFCWVYYLTKLGDVSLLGAGALAIASACLCATKKTAKKVTNKKIAKQLALQFALYGDQGVIESLYQFVGYNTTKIDGAFVATKDDEKHLVVLQYGIKSASCQVLVNSAKSAFDKGCEYLAFWCNGVDGEMAKYLDLLPVKATVYDAKLTVDLLTKYNKMPPIKINKRVSNTPVLNYAFNHKRTKNYLVSSAFAFGLAFLSYFPLYNLIWATLFALAGLYSRFNKRFNLQQETVSI